jgi:hypothetical protein
MIRQSQPKKRYTITLEAAESDVPTVIRLRRVLKGMLRGFGFRCVSAEEVGHDDGAQPARSHPLEKHQAP